MDLIGRGDDPNKEIDKYSLHLFPWLNSAILDHLLDKKHIRPRHSENAPCGVAVRARSGPISMRDSRQPSYETRLTDNRKLWINHLTLPSVNGPPKFKGQGIPLWWFDGP